MRTLDTIQFDFDLSQKIKRNSHLKMIPVFLDDENEMPIDGLTEEDAPVYIVSRKRRSIFDVPAKQSESSKRRKQDPDTDLASVYYTDPSGLGDFPWDPHYESEDAVSTSFSDHSDEESTAASTIDQSDIMSVSSGSTSTTSPTEGSATKERGENAHAQLLIQALLCPDDDQGHAMDNCLRNPLQLLHRMADLMSMDEYAAWSTRLQPTQLEHTRALIRSFVDKKEEQQGLRAHRYQHLLALLPDLQDPSQRQCRLAMVCLLLGSVLYSDSRPDQLSHDAAVFAQTSYGHRLQTHPILRKPRYAGMQRDLERVYSFLRHVVSFFGNLEVLLLVASCIDGRGVFQQRAGKKASYTTKSYHFLIESMNGVSAQNIQASVVRDLFC